LTRVRAARTAFALCAWLVAACSLLRPLDDLESSQSSLRTEPCPDEMQQVRFEDGATFCIDKRETTRLEYEEFLMAPVSELALPQKNAELCPAPDSFEPGGGADCMSAYEPGVTPDLPVVCVDLCDAMAYCGFRGKRLCGGRGGETVDSESVNSPSDEWFVACTGGTAREYPYENFRLGICNVESPGVQSADERPGCETPDHIEQLSGNVAEWVLVCQKPRPAAETQCLVRGGEYGTMAAQLAGCRHLPDIGEVEPRRSRRVSGRGPGVGIRCCKD
jgi:formylglycine-generating enzyme required for sulfatase activity